MDKTPLRNGDLVYIDGILNPLDTDNISPKPFKALIINILETSKIKYITYLQENRSIKHIKMCTSDDIISIDNKIENMFLENIKPRIKIVNSQIPEIGKTALFRKVNINNISYDFSGNEKFKIIDIIDRSKSEECCEYEEDGEPMNPLLILRPTKHWNHVDTFILDASFFYIS